VVLGAGGFVGSALAQAAAAFGWSVTHVTRQTYGTWAGRPFDLVINANGNARKIVANRDPLFDFDASARSVYQSILDFPHEHYVLISTVDVYPDHRSCESTCEATPIDPLRLDRYGFHKRLAEQIVQRECKSWHILRLAQMGGPGLRKGPLYDLLSGGPLWVHQDSKFPFLNTANLARCALSLVADGPRNEIFNVCGRGSVRLGDAVGLLPPSRQDLRYAATDLHEYCVSTDKTCAQYPLPDSWDEVRAFVEQSLTCGSVQS